MLPLQRQTFYGAGRACRIGSSEPWGLALVPLTRTSFSTLVINRKPREELKAELGKPWVSESQALHLKVRFKETN